jgi:hypothetical protein
MMKRLQEMSTGRKTIQRIMEYFLFAIGNIIELLK